MKKFSILLLLSSFSIIAMAQNKNIVEIAMGSEDHTILVAAVSAAGLVPILQGEGPFTVFAPTNAAFQNLPAGTVESLLEPGNKDALTSVLTYHVVSGNLDAATVLSAIEAGKGKAELTTVQGGKLVGSLNGGKVKLTDANGNSVFVTAVDLKGSNGVIHVIDGVVLPK
jgi:uncharacterized surface protein with fasciclin (FAS1) repeats